MSKLNFHVGRTVHFAHGYRNVGGREVGGKRVLVFMFHQFSKESPSLKFVYSYSRVYSQNKKSQNKITEVKVFTVFLVTVCQGGVYSIR